ncbi:Universal stress protein family protein [Paractinoplanes atraurantiacus]|uniref:Universal stress protein family protein n=2 Tax=Paractinoplanes atraurantiacus TaxID=1036182 RepID=A0A285JJG8_9ACTN|nr:Universal stress protein family protein [Actinoplanes atraurantiacus]
MSAATLPHVRVPSEPATSAVVRAAGPVVVAVDDDGNARRLLRRGSEMAERLGVPLRVVYIWSDCRPPHCMHHRRCLRDIGEALRFVDTLVGNHLGEPGPAVERDVVHAADPAGALADVSAGASLLVVGETSDHDATGGTAAAVLVRATCPVTVVPHRPRSITQSVW